MTYDFFVVPADLAEDLEQALGVYETTPETGALTPGGPVASFLSALAPLEAVGVRARGGDAGAYVTTSWDDPMGNLRSVAEAAAAQGLSVLDVQLGVLYDPRDRLDVALETQGGPRLTFVTRRILRLVLSHIRAAHYHWVTLRGPRTCSCRPTATTTAPGPWSTARVEGGTSRPGRPTPCSSSGCSGRGRATTGAGRHRSPSRPSTSEPEPREMAGRTGSGRKASGGTPATVALTRARVAFTEYRYGTTRLRRRTAGGGGRELWLEPAHVFKTLCREGRRPALVGVVPVAGQLDLKALAAAADGRRAEMADPAMPSAPPGTSSAASPRWASRAPPTVVYDTALGFRTVSRSRYAE